MRRRKPLPDGQCPPVMRVAMNIKADSHPDIAKLYTETCERFSDIVIEALSLYALARDFTGENVFPRVITKLVQPHAAKPTASTKLTADSAVEVVPAPKPAPAAAEKPQSPLVSSMTSVMPAGNEEISEQSAKAMLNLAQSM